MCTQYRVNNKFCKLPFARDFGKKVDIRKISVLNHFKQALKGHLSSLKMPFTDALHIFVLYASGLYF